MYYKLYFAVLTSLLCQSISITTVNSKSHPDSEFQEGLAHINAFSGCIIKVINFPGKDMNGAKLREPIMLQRFFSLPGKETIFPIEILSRNQSEQSGKDAKYISLLNSVEFQTSKRNSKCDAEIFVEPPTLTESPEMFRKQLGYWQLKHERLVWLYTNWEQNIWKLQRLNTLTMYSVLVTKVKMENLECYVTGSTCQTWAEGVWMHPQLASANHELFIWKISMPVEILAHCKFCDPCHPFKFLSIPLQNLDGRNWLLKMLNLLMNQARKLTIDTVLSGFVPMGYWLGNTKYNSKTATQFLLRRPLRNERNVAHVLVVSYVPPRNATLNLHGTFSGKKLTYKELAVAGCFNQAKVKYSPNHLLRMDFTAGVNIAELSELGLIVDRIQLRFVACHALPKSWITQLKELISPFDLITWFLVITSTVSLSLFIYLRTRQLKSTISFGDALYETFALLLEKSHKIYNSTHGMSKELGYYASFATPFVLLVLSNEYRGDNISRLTVAPGLYPFDEFDTLVEHKFKVYTWEKRLQKYMYKILKEHVNITTDLQRTSNHEFFPIVSRFWNQVMVPFKWSNTIQGVSHRLPNRTLFYLNHSEIFDLENVLELYNKRKHKLKWQERATLYLRQCNKSAAIFPRGLAIKAYKNLSNINAPVFFGKDVLHENLYGYGIGGLMPLIVHLRQNYIFQSGICSFWDKFMDYVLELEVNIRNRDSSDKKFSFDQDSSTARNVLLIIPGGGLLICLLVFLHETRHFGSSSLISAKKNLRTIFNYLWCLKIWQLKSHRRNINVVARRIFVSTTRL